MEESAGYFFKGLNKTVKKLSGNYSEIQAYRRKRFCGYYEKVENRT